MLPSNAQKACIQCVDAYSDLIIREVMAGTAPKLICLSFGACDALVAVATVTGVSSFFDHSIDCGLCLCCRKIGLGVTEIITCVFPNVYACFMFVYSCVYKLWCLIVKSP